MSEVDNIVINYENQITDIGIEYINEITDIILSIGADVQSVFSVNGLNGTVVLTASGVLGSVSSSGGIYSHQFSHNLNYSIPVVSVYNPTNQLVEPDVEILDSNNVTIKSGINLSGYKVVVQR